MSNKLSFFIDSHVGGRRQNEDNFGYIQEEVNENLHSTWGYGSVFIVADGMGGANAGEVASQILVETIQKSFGEKRASGLATHDAIHELILEANSEICRQADADPNKKGMGTTGLVVAIEHGILSYVHVGDSRLYGIIDNKFQPLTADHTVVQRLLNQGEITKEEAKKHPKAHVLTRTIGRSRIEVDLNFHRTYQTRENIFLLCSDGLYGAVSDEIIEQAMQRLTPKDAVETLISLALSLRASDNITIAVINGKEDFEGENAYNFKMQYSSLMAVKNEFSTHDSIEFETNSRTTKIDHNLGSIKNMKIKNKHPLIEQVLSQKEQKTISNNNTLLLFLTILAVLFTIAFVVQQSN